MADTHFESALILRHWDWSETSQIVALFTRERGAIRALAKGSRRPASPFSGGVEALTLGNAGLILKPDRELAAMTEWDLRDALPHFRSDLRTFHAGMYIVDLIRNVVLDSDPHPALFDHTVEALRALERGPRLISGVLLRLQWAALVETGYEPNLDEMIGSGAPVAGDLYFSPADGGFVGPNVAGTWRISRSTLELLRTLRGLAPGEHASASAASVARGAALLAAYLTWILGRPLVTGALVLPGLSAAGSSRSGTNAPGRVRKI